MTPRSVLSVAGLVAMLAAGAAGAQAVDTTLWAPNGSVLGVAVSGGRVYVCGRFTSFRGVPRNGLASLDVATGRLTDWDPNPDGLVWAVAVVGNTVCVGGEFTHVGGQPRSHLAALDATTGAATHWDSLAAGYGVVYTLVASGGSVYAGGNGFVAALDPTAEHETWYQSGVGVVYGLAVQTPTLYAGGLFTSIGGQARNNLADLNVYSGAVGTWNPGPNNPVNALAVDGGTVYAGGSFNQVGQSVRSGRNKLAAIDGTTGNATSWNPGAGGGVLALAAGQGIVYAGGGFMSVDGASRTYLAALRESDGTATSWDPHAGSTIYTIALDGATVYVGGQFGSIGGQSQAFLARMPDSPTGTLLARFDAEVGSEGVLLHWRIQSDVHSVSVERSGSESGPWTLPPVETTEQGDVTVALDRTAEAGHDYWYRLVATMGDGSVAEFGPIQAQVPESIRTSGIVRVAPNPTNKTTHVVYQAARREPVRLSVVDVAGREAVVLFAGELAAGRYSAVWDGAGQHGSLPAGLYFIRWRSPSRTMQRRLVLMR
jgi:hypothetical protein